MIIHGDCLEKLKDLEDNSVDSVVTDPPYGLSFMGKKWDYDVPDEEVWAECLRVLKPGGYLLAFAGTRTQHRMAVRIEDAGFEIRDMIFWTYASGFPKSLNIEKQLQKMYEKTISSEQEAKHDLRPMSDTDLQKTEFVDKEQGEVLQSELSEQSIPIEGVQLSSEVRRGQPSLEGGSNILQQEGELQTDKVCEMSEGISDNGEEGQLCNGAQTSNGEDDRKTTREDRGGTSYKSQSTRQQKGKPDAFSKQQIAQAIRTHKGFGTALKPSCEPITVARKPISEKNIAENCLKWGTGGINIDGCRVGTETRTNSKGKESAKGSGIFGEYGDMKTEIKDYGRFPANFIHDGSEEVVELFPDTKSTSSKGHFRKGNVVGDGRTSVAAGQFGDGAWIEGSKHNDSGSASRFFYCAKASKKDRNEGCEELEEKVKPLMGEFKDNPGRETPKSSPTPRSNFHPTVKPTKLMQYLVRLVTPKSGTVLDPFMGSGSTGKACRLEGFDFIGIEREEDYIKIAEARIEATKPENKLI